MADAQILNAGRRTYRTSKGFLAPGKIQIVSEAEGKKLLSYRDLKDVAKMGPAAKGMADLMAENKQLQKDKKDLQDRLAEFLDADKKDLPGLQEKHADAIPDAAAEPAETAPEQKP